MVPAKQVEVWTFAYSFLSNSEDLQKVADLDVLLALPVFMPLEAIHGDLEKSLISGV